MKITFGPDGSQSLEITADDTIFLGKLRGLLSFGKRRRIRHFGLCRELQTKHRSFFSSIALGYYVNRGYATEGLQLICQPAWICEGLIELEKVTLNWDRAATERAATPLRQKSFPYKGGFAENVLAVFPDTRLDNLKSYRLLAVSSQGSSFQFTFTLGDYFEYVNTCEAMAFELCEGVVSRYATRITKRGGESLPATVDLSTLTLPHRQATDIYDFRNRGAVPGINTLLIMLGPRPGDHKFYYHMRSSEGVAEAMNARHVVPAGTFQPGTEEDQFHQRDFSMIRNIKREFAEELLGQEEMRKVQTGERDFIDSEAFKPYESLLKEGNIKLFFMGLGLDPLTTKPEILTCMVVNGLGLRARRLEDGFADSFEGKYHAAPFTVDRLRQFAGDPITLPAGEACFRLAIKHHKDLIAVF